MGTNKSNEPSDENESNNILKFISNSGIYTSLSQLSHISIAPTQLMLFSSIPLLGGSYLGYRRQMRLISDSTNPSNMKFALRALSIGSMLSVGGFGIVTASIFYATGSSSLNELIEKCQIWAPNHTRTLQSLFGFDISARSYEKWKHDEDIIATKNMSEDEVFEFYKAKYVMPEVDNESKVELEK